MSQFSLGQPELLKSIALPADGSETCTKIKPSTAVQSSTLNKDGVATRAIDGNAATFTVTAGGKTFPWIAVQIAEDGTSVPVKRVVIINIVQLDGSRLRNMQVFVADQIPTSSGQSFAGPGVQPVGPLFTGPGKDGQIIEVTSNRARGRFVVIQMQGVRDYLNLAEITVFSN